MNIGIDIGWTLKGVRAEYSKNRTAPNSFETIRKLVKRGDTVYFISKCNSSQKAEVEQWIKEVDLFKQTNTNPENLYFCFERKDKSLFVKALDIQIMIDDRTEVMAHLNPMVVKVLLDPELSEYETYKHRLCNTTVVKNWYEIERALL
jgi:hypothetical protein